MNGMMCRFQRGDGMTGGDHVHTEIADGCPRQCPFGQTLKINDFEEAKSEEVVAEGPR
jgi:hypothetical protein